MQSQFVGSYVHAGKESHFRRLVLRAINPLDSTKAKRVLHCPHEAGRLAVCRVVRGFSLSCLLEGDAAFLKDGEEMHSHQASEMSFLPALERLGIPRVSRGNHIPARVSGPKDRRGCQKMCESTLVAPVLKMCHFVDELSRFRKRDCDLSCYGIFTPIIPRREIHLHAMLKFHVSVCFTTKFHRSSPSLSIPFVVNFKSRNL
ncbi:uncharacterized protein K489DRAFT_170177 [Dissoconium aciculare CBS 342.82]|uniref:Uncharacterized protein n=1 Tax=Dissoconium aciculare CBS 342.82 TaxID=1314786 RepID=A0A6J3M7I7_9PEZI|nr:uncharacterized protein K489DRAFT_170177 [Dissoconium aciculare CBS 342.82]KAF1823965.1 hypothetical protein K489DRAFT_170177 [Dissoconium aciculare CBS 342.82]